MVKKVALKYHSNDRRGFSIQNLKRSKVLQDRSIEEIVIQSVNPEEEICGHYHKNIQWFMALNGEADLIWFEKKDSEETKIETIHFRADYQNPYLLEIPPMHCHWIKNCSKEVFIMAILSAKERNPANPDSYHVKHYSSQSK